ncbi:MAG: L-serine ammonia-lyase, iron-sulfur-dependent, subunit alpha [Solobacterium sp.]|nr:L-serine ammonia-lyase, iron-sulfur-dependent, subunit alpha [Solobacterium sp.]
MKKEVAKWTVFSLGGGSIQIKEFPLNFNAQVYQEKSFKEIESLIKKEEITLLDYIYRNEKELQEYLISIVEAMEACVQHGLDTTGVLPGSLALERTAHELYKAAIACEDKDQNDALRLMAYAYAASEENADGKTCVTAPTLGACGVMAAFVYYCLHDLKEEKSKVADAIAIGGLFGNLIKENATISGAVGGCQAEVGAAVSMTSAAFSYILGLDVGQIEYAAEIGMEHNLGLTCDPVLGYVMIPCIERNAMGIMRARDASLLSKHMSKIKKHVVSFDVVVDTMNETGKQIPIELKETSVGGLAKEFKYE